MVVGIRYEGNHVIISFFYEKLFLFFAHRYGNSMCVLEVIGGIAFLFLVGFAPIYWQIAKVAKANPAGNVGSEKANRLMSENNKREVN